MHRRAARLVRQPTAVLLTAILALAAPAENREIPRKLLEQQARTRAAFTPAERARTQALEARLSPKMSVNDVIVMTRGEPAGAVFVLMMEWLKLANKEARDDRKIAGIAAKESVAARDAKLAQDNKKIDTMQREADDRYDHVMTAANWDMALSIVSSAAAACAAGATQPHTAQALPGAAAPIVAPAAVPGVSVPTRTPTKVPGAGKQAATANAVTCIAAVLLYRSGALEPGTYLKVTVALLVAPVLVVTLLTSRYVRALVMERP